MILSMSGQVKLFFLTVGIGFAVGFVYDFFRILRRLIKHSALVCNLEDGLYWIGVSALMFYFMLNKNYGEIRLFSIIGAFTGMILYFLTLSQYMIKVALVIVRFLEQVIIAMYKIIMFPIKIIWNVIKTPFMLIGSIFKKYSPKGKKLLQKPGKYAKIKTSKMKKDLHVIFKKI